jgi:hypothetical protein
LALAPPKRPLRCRAVPLQGIPTKALPDRYTMKYSKLRNILQFLLLSWQKYTTK